MSDSWLQAYLLDAVERKLCTRIYCTTCGARKFRLGVLVALARATGQPPQQRFDRESVLEIAKALRGVAPTPPQARTWESAMRCLLFDLWTGLPMFDKDIQTLLDGTWAGGVLAAMQAHHRAAVAASDAREAFEQGAEGRRIEKKRLKQEQHRARLAVKVERDRLWREQQAK